MDLVLLLARLVLAAVFATAGAAKFLDLAGSRQAMREFGVPVRFSTPLGTLLPLAELAIAFALIPRATAWWSALSALSLLLAFVAGIGANLVRGNKPDCHCFGQLHSAPAGWPTLARNAGLAAIAAFILFQGRDDPGASASAWAGDLSTLEAAALGIGTIALLLATGLGWAVVHLLRQHGRLLLRLDALETQIASDGIPVPKPATSSPTRQPGLVVGTRAPAFDLPTVEGDRFSLNNLLATSKPLLLVFSDPGCGPCTSLMPDLSQWQQEHADNLTLVVVSRGTVEVNRTKASEHGLRNVLVQTDREVAQAYQAYGTPGAVLVRPDGTIGSPLAQGVEAIRALVARAAGTRRSMPSISLRPVPAHANGNNGNGTNPSSPARRAAAPQVGEAAPALRLPDLDGNQVNLAAATKPMLVLFWNPGCGFCRRMLGDLKAWEANSREDSPQLLVISAGDVETNRSLGLRSTVVLDQGFTTGRRFGASGTPSAVLIDADARIASELVVGGPAVLALASTLQQEAVSADE